MTNRSTLASLALVACMLALSSLAGVAQSPGPQPLPFPPATAQPVDVPYPGTIRLQVDAADLDRRVFTIRETIPVRGAGPLVLLYPQWLPGSHSPTGRLDKLAGLTIRAGGRRIEWVRDPVDVFAFHVNVPAGASALELEYHFASSLESNEGRVVITPEMLNLQWVAVTLYPAGHFARQITVQPSVRLPEGWQFATALETESTNGATTVFKPVSLEMLMDSPMFAGRHFKRLDLDPGGRSPVYLNLVADRPESLEVSAEQLQLHRALVQQADKLFASRHFRHYDFLLALTERLGGIGLEHHQSSENASSPGYFTDWNQTASGRDLLPHEYSHSWNGKFRRPADLWTPNYNVPMRDSLLWVYEGQTQYWGQVLAARSGLWTPAQALDALAAVAATYDHRPGREWKTLQDTTNDPIVAMRRPLAWRSWARSEDYYSEGQLLWLDVDTLIREKSGDRKSLDDFTRLFFGVSDGSIGPLTYTFEDVVSALNQTQPHDWSKFLRDRLDGHGPGAPLDGIARGGYKLVYSETPTDSQRSSESRRGVADLTYSLGMTVGREGRVVDVLWEGLAFKHAIAIGVQVVAVNNIAFTPDLIRTAVKDSKANGSPIELLLKSGDRYRTLRLDYRGGLRYPRLERDASKPARLDQILAPRS